MTKLAEARLVADLPNHYWTVEQYHSMVAAAVFKEDGSFAKIIILKTHDVVSSPELGDFKVANIL